jgi:hypothetical protein
VVFLEALAKNKAFRERGQLYKKMLSDMTWSGDSHDLTMVEDMSLVGITLVQS